MVFGGEVVGEDYIGSAVGLNRRGDLVVQQAETVGLIFSKPRRIDADEVVSWHETFPGARKPGGVIGAIFSGAPFQGVAGKVIGTGSGVDAAHRARHARIEWAGGRSSVVMLPPELFARLEAMLADRRVGPTAPSAERDREQRLTPELRARLDELEQLRDRGILTHAEFAAKRDQLLDGR